MELLDFIQFEQILSSFFPTPLQPATFQPVEIRKYLADIFELDLFPAV